MAITTGSPFVMAVLSEKEGFQIATQLDDLSAMGILNMASEGLIGNLMQGEDEAKH